MICVTGSAGNTGFAGGGYGVVGRQSHGYGICPQQWGAGSRSIVRCGQPGGAEMADILIPSVDVLDQIWKMDLYKNKKVAAASSI